MHFNVKKRDGPARIGEFVIEEKTVTTPNIFYINTQRFTAPDFANILITDDKLEAEKPTMKVLGSIFSPEKSTKKDDFAVSNYLVYPKDVSQEVHAFAIQLNKKNKSNCYVLPANVDIIDKAVKNNDASIFIVANAAQLFSQQSKFVEFVTTAREKIGYQKMLYLPSIGAPTNLAILAYIGVDFFDSISAILAARNNTLLFSTGACEKNALVELPCNCPSCNKFKGAPSEMTYSQILVHNYYSISNELKQVRNAISQGNLRELVEVRVRTYPSLTAILRTLDNDYYDFLEERVPVTRKSQLLSTTKESLSRPEIKRFQKQVIERYEKPESTKILLLLPCSSKKPYSFSKSHKLFRERLFDVKNPHVVHEVIITSPLGIVPRELELTYPASSYDISVTGHWDEDEKTMIRTMLKQYLEKNSYNETIVHLPAPLQEFVNDLLHNPVITCVDKPTSSESLEKLSDALQKSTDSYEKITASKRVNEDVGSLASFQFGKKAAKTLLKGSQIRGKYPYQKIFSEQKQIGMIAKERGLTSLTMEGAERLKEFRNYWVEIYDDFLLKGSVLAPGVKNADKAIRIGEEVLVFKNRALCAVGVAQMNGKEMKESSKGEAVKIRHSI